MNETRLIWIDWMKALSMFLIVCGHCFVPGYKYIYVFNVPCFFIISGFLSKFEKNYIIFFKKILWNLIIPSVIFWTINILVQFIEQIVTGSFRLSYLYQAPLLSLLGMQGENYSAGGLKTLWFVYTLIICKIILQLIPEKNKSLILVILCALFLCMAFILNKIGFNKYNAIINVLLAMPFFTIGNLLRAKKKVICNLSTSSCILTLTIGIVGLIISGTYNKIVMLYNCSYGSSVFLCLLGGVCGTMAIYSISMIFGAHLVRLSHIMGSGTLIVLSLHVLLLKAFDSLFTITDFWRYFEAFFINIAFYPIILLIKHRAPILYGRYR